MPASPVIPGSSIRCDGASPLATARSLRRISAFADKHLVVLCGLLSYYADFHLVCVDAVLGGDRPSQLLAKQV